MQPERQIAVACVMLGGAFIYPGANLMLHQSGATAGGLYFAGGLVGSLGVFFGALLAFDLDGGMRLLFGGLWALAALALAAAMGLAAWHEPGLGWRIGFALTGALPLLTYALIGWRVNRISRR